MKATHWLLLAIAALVAFGLYSTLRESPSTSLAPDPQGLAQATAPDLGDDSRQTAPATGQHLSAGSAPRISIPLHFRFAGVESVPVGESWDELLAGFSDEDRVQIEAFSGAFDAAAYRFSGEQELAWLAGQGFPMPDEILAASAMGEAELKELALRGSPKAAYFFMARQVESGSHRTIFTGRDHEERERVRAVALAAGSPFLGYVEAELKAQNYPESPASARAGPLAWAALRGDRRAAYAIERDGIDPVSLLIGVNGLMSEEQAFRSDGYIQSPPAQVRHFPLGATLNAELVRRAQQSRP